MEVKGRDLVSGIPKTVRVHSSEIREAIQEPIQQIVDAVRRALEITPPELASDIVDRGIVMTGGGALIRGLDLLLAQETGLPIHVDEDAAYLAQGIPSLMAENERLRGLLSLSRRVSSPYVAAEVMHQAQATDGRTLLIDVGRDDLVSEFDPVVAPEGLIGMVLTAGRHSSVVMTWAHPEFRVAAYTVGGNASGVGAVAVGARR